jgi:ferrochelatase
MSARDPIDSVLMIGFGGPASSSDVRPFLDNVLRGRAIPKDRYEAVVQHYKAIGGRSPYNEWTLRQRDALRAMLAARDVAIPVEVGMRNWSPCLEEAIRTLVGSGARNTLGFIMAAFRCEASWERYQMSAREAATKVGAAAPQIVYPSAWNEHPRFIAAIASRIRETLRRLDERDRARAALIFTAHGIPCAMSNDSGYARQVEASCELVARACGFSRWRLAYQSRSGNPRESWLEPDVLSVIRDNAGGVAVVAPIGFLCDHVEVLYDLDIEAAAVARDAGVTMVRAPTVGDHPEFIAMMCDIVREHRGG